VCCANRRQYFLAIELVGLAGWLSMVFVKHRVAINRQDLVQVCLDEIRLWPGCGTVQSLGVLGDLRGGFTVHVVKYGLAKKRIADRAVRCIQREKSRQYCLKAE
jgi:hypothetical protein